MNCQDNSLYVKLPAPKAFHRPLWAYEKLSDGLHVLRTNLFGETHLVMQDLNQHGNQPISQALLDRVLPHYHLNPDIRCVILRNALGNDAKQFVAWYRNWEDELFTKYWDYHYQLETVDPNRNDSFFNL